MKWRFISISIVLIIGHVLAIALVDHDKGDLLAEDSLPARVEPEANQGGLHVWFSLQRPKGARYRRPYVAIWLEDQDGFPVKTGILWLQTNSPGPRWHRDLARWYRNDRMRKLAENTNLIDGISGPTRGPGNYRTHFDGTDNNGKELPHGEYTLCLEAAREHGTYKIIREKIQWGVEGIAKKDLKGNIEIPMASYYFVPLQPKDL